jgi:predicted DNA-binding transcriptional regulator YafY
MTRTPGVHETLAYRLSQIILKLNKGESVTPEILAEEFKVDLRTIQRDLNIRLADLDLIKIAGRYRLQEHKLGKVTIQDIKKFASSTGIDGLFPKLTDSFLFDAINSQTTSAWMVKGHQYEEFQGENTFFPELEQAILNHRHIEFIYKKNDGLSKLHQHIEPYQLINNKGIWYLAAWDFDKLKSFSISKMTELNLNQSTFLPQPQIIKELEGSDSIWIGTKRERILLRVGKQAAGYFKRRKLIPNQSIEKEFDCGDLLISSMVAHHNEILPIVRYWVPHIMILEPSDLQNKMVTELKDYLQLLVDSK